MKIVKIRSFFWFVFYRIRTESLRIQSEFGKIRTRKNSVFGHFSRSVISSLHKIHRIQMYGNISKSRQLQIFYLIWFFSPFLIIVEFLGCPRAKFLGHFRRDTFTCTMLTTALYELTIYQEPGTAKSYRIFREFWTSNTLFLTLPSQHWVVHKNCVNCG